MTIRCQTISDAQTLVALAEDWWDLWRRSPAATPFQSPAWVIPWWRAFAPGELFTVAAWKGRSMVGLAPFYREGRRLLPLGISLSDYLDVLLDSDARGAAGGAIVDHYSELAPHWDEWELAELHPGAAALALPCPRGCEETAGPDSPCPVLALAHRAGPPTGMFPRRIHRRLSNALNRAARRGGAISERIGPESAEHGFRELVRLHEARWHKRGQPGLFSDPRTVAFHNLALGPLARHGLLRFYLLRISDRVASAYYGLAHRLHTYAYMMSFDPELGHECPGTILLGDVVKEAIGEGMQELHFLRGEEPYKLEWGAEVRWNRRRVFRRTDRYGTGG